MNKQTVLVYLFFLCTFLQLHAQIDLELSINSSNLNPAAYTHVPLTYTITNTGTINATNIRVFIGVCNPSNPLNPHISPFQQSAKVVNSSSPLPSVSLGTYNATSQNWLLPELATGSSATLDLSVFVLTEDERLIIGYVSEADQNDVDSTPTYSSSCETSEDDEASLTLNGGNLPSCNYQDLDWLTDRLDDNTALCEDCISSIIVYEVGSTTYIGFNADNNNCNDALTTIYNCDGTIFCQEGGLAGLTECDDWRALSPSQVTQLWSKQNNCIINNRTMTVLAWFDENHNGVKEPEIDYPLANMNIQVEDVNNNIIASGQTNEDGIVSFQNLSTNTYRVVFEGLEGSAPTFKWAPGAGLLLNSDINADGKTDIFTDDLHVDIQGGFYDISSEVLTDLELSLNVSNSTPAAYENVPVTYTIRNEGVVTATDIKIRTGICRPENPTYISVFNQNNGIVNGSPSPSTSAGTYSTTSQVWTISELMPGASATLDLTLFTLTNEERLILGEVFFATPNDIDSQIDNMVNCQAQEDDEASATFNGSPIPKPDFDLNSFNLLEVVFPSGIEAIQPNSEVVVGNTIELNSLQMTGTIPGPQLDFDAVTKFYLSADENIDDNDLVLFIYDNHALNFLTPTNSYFTEGANGAFSIPESTSPGFYNIIAKFDADEEIMEENENNNIVILPIMLTNNCICPHVIDPVCGSNGLTYENYCEAECAGIFDYTLGECTISSDGIDLELEIIAPSTYAIYTNTIFQIRVYNNGNINAENVIIDAPLLDGFVHSSNSATIGDYDLFREQWNVGTVKVGETAVLDLNLFALTSGAVTAYAQVATAAPDDVDSTPNNGTCCTPNEDDEAALTIGNNIQSGNGNTAFAASSSNLDLDIKTIYPNIATDKITIFVQSKLPTLQLRIYNLQGHELLQQQYSDTEGFQRLPLDVSTLPTGTYFIRFDGTLGRQTLRFVKMRM